MSIELIKRQIEAQLIDYEQTIQAYAAFMEDWRNRTDPARQRLERFRKAKQRELS